MEENIRRKNQMRQEKNRLNKERQAKEEQERLAREAQEKQAKEEQARQEQEKQAKEEQARQEQERLAKEEQERLAKEEEERLAKEQEEQSLNAQLLEKYKQKTFVKNIQKKKPETNPNNIADKENKLLNVIQKLNEMEDFESDDELNSQIEEDLDF